MKIAVLTTLALIATLTSASSFASDSAGAPERVFVCGQLDGYCFGATLPGQPPGSGGGCMRTISGPAMDRGLTIDAQTDIVYQQINDLLGSWAIVSGYMIDADDISVDKVTPVKSCPAK